MSQAPALKIVNKQRELEAEAREAHMEWVRRKVAPTEVPRNPDKPPPLDPFMVSELKRLGHAVGKEYRWHWMEVSRIWSIEVRVNADKWQTVFAVYDEDKACEGTWEPYKHPDRRDLEEFCESDLAIRYGTGDLDKDMALRNKEVDERGEMKKAKAHADNLMAIFQAVTRGDPKRHDRFLDHVGGHTFQRRADGDLEKGGCGFKEFHAVGVDLKKGSSE
jgi:hypothetical protein